MGREFWLILDPTKSELTCIAHLLQIRNIYIDYECQISSPSFQDAIQAQLVIQKMSELTTQESSDDLDPISESPSKTLDEDRESSSDGNDETLGDDDIIDAIDEVTDDPKADHAAATIESKNNDNNSSLDTANANLDFRNVTDIENNIPVSSFS